MPRLADLGFTGKVFTPQHHCCLAARLRWQAFCSRAKQLRSGLGSGQQTGSSRLAESSQAVRVQLGTTKRFPATVPGLGFAGGGPEQGPCLSQPVGCRVCTRAAFPFGCLLLTPVYIQASAAAFPGAAARLCFPLSTSASGTLIQPTLGTCRQAWELLS